MKQKVVCVNATFFASEAFQKVSPAGRLLSLALLQLSDHEGLIRWNETMIRAYAFPAEPCAPVAAMVEELEGIEFLTVLERDGEDYLWLPGAMEPDNA